MCSLDDWALTDWQVRPSLLRLLNVARRRETITNTRVLRVVVVDLLPVRTCAAAEIRTKDW